MSEPPIDEGLLRRFRRAGQAIVWTQDEGPRRRPRGTVSRTARLGQETAQVETVEQRGARAVRVTSGPVGALVLLLEVDRRGPPTSLGSQNAGADPAFPDGSIVAAWGARELRADAHPTLHDLIELARYALA